jgi:hypothetical protein
LRSSRIPGTTVSASDLVSRTQERMELRAKIRELVKAGRAQSIPAKVRASSKKASPRQERMPMDEEQAASAAAVFQSISGIEMEQSSKSGPPGAPGTKLSMSSTSGTLTTTVSRMKTRVRQHLKRYLSRVYWSQT